MSPSVPGEQCDQEGWTYAEYLGSYEAGSNFQTEPTFFPGLNRLGFPKESTSRKFLFPILFQSDKSRREVLSGVFVKANHTGRDLNPLPFSIRRQ